MKLFFMMNRLLLLLLITSNFLIAQTKVSGIVLDDNKKPIAYANVAFKGTSEGIITNEDGRFYLESSQNRKILSLSFVGYKDLEIVLDKAVTYNMVVTLSNGEDLKEVKVFAGKVSKKNNPAIDILRKIWARKRKNGLRQFNQ